MDDANTKKQQMEYIAVGLLVLVALFMGLSRFRQKDKDDEVFSRNEFNKRWKEVEILEVNIPKEEEGIDYIITVERTPFKSPFEEKEKEEKVLEEIILPPMTFQGMIWNSMRPQAIVDNKVYDVGDVMVIGSGEARSEVEVEAIKMDGIYLKYKGRVFIVRPK